jgi:hypothetical protein
MAMAIAERRVTVFCALETDRYPHTVLFNKAAERVACASEVQVRASNCLGCQEVSAVFACQHVRCVTMAFTIVSRLRMLAVKATLAALPAARNRS